MARWKSPGTARPLTPPKPWPAPSCTPALRRSRRWRPRLHRQAELNACAVRPVHGESLCQAGTRDSTPRPIDQNGLDRAAGSLKERGNYPGHTRETSFYTEAVTAGSPALRTAVLSWRLAPRWLRGLVAQKTGSGASKVADSCQGSH